MDAWHEQERSPLRALRSICGQEGRSAQRDRQGVLDDVARFPFGNGPRDPLHARGLHDERRAADVVVRGDVAGHERETRNTRRVPPRVDATACRRIIAA